MQSVILLAVLVYLFAITIGVGWWEARRKSGNQDEFILSGRSLSVAEVGITLALTVLGSVHILGLFEMSWFLGSASIWFGIGSAIMIAVVCATTGRWIRRLQVVTAAGMINEVFQNETLRLMTACVGAPLIWGILTLETQGLGIVLASLTGWSLKQSIILSAILGILYVNIAGMKQIAKINLINVGILYAGVVVGLIFLTFALPQGWNGVSEFYLTENQPWMLDIMGPPGTLITFALVNLLALVFFHMINQGMLQPIMSAKNDSTIRRAVWIAVPVNVAFGAFTIAMGIAAKSLPEFAALGPKLAAPTMLVQLLPTWVVTWILASFILTILSTYAMFVLTPATVFVKDIYIKQFKQNASEHEQEIAIRTTIIVLAVLAIIPAVSLPPIVAAILWLFSWLAPISIFLLFGLFWKRSNRAFVITCVVAWIVNSLWSLTSLPEMLHMAGFPNIYTTLVITLVLGGILTAVMGEKSGYFVQDKKQSAVNV